MLRIEALVVHTRGAGPDESHLKRRTSMLGSWSGSVSIRSQCPADSADIESTAIDEQDLQQRITQLVQEACALSNERDEAEKREQAAQRNSEELQKQIGERKER